MAQFTQVLATDFSFPHVDIYRQYEDGVMYGYEALTHDGYVMYDTTANDTEPSPDPDNPGDIPVTYYYTSLGMPPTADLTRFMWIAVPRDSVDYKYIFGGNNNTSEIM